ncbi:MAG: OmpA family protein [Actinomycetota bacterium]|nr:OmpA family protein [Actinomycetota bacterium]
MAKKKVANRLRQIGDSTPSGSMPPMPGRPSDSQMVEIGLFVSATVVGTFLLVVFGTFFGLRSIENHLETTAKDALVAAEVVDVEVEASGVDLHLRGTVAEEEQLATVPVFVAAIEGVGSVETELVWIEPVDAVVTEVVANPITVTWANGSVTIKGEVSDDPNRAALVAALEDLFPAGVDAEQLALKEGAPSERDWLSKAVTLIRIGAETLSEGEIFINADQRLVQMTGEYETRQERRDARDSIDTVIAATTFAFVSGLGIPEPPAFTAAEVIELQGNLDELIEGKVVEFELNSDVLTSVGATLLDEILAALVQFPNVPIEIGGHTDNQGDELENLDLSERRARTAYEYLTARGQDPDRFIVVGYGEGVPVASNDTTDGRARNRRIEFKALGE